LQLGSLVFISSVAAFGTTSPKTGVPLGGWRSRAGELLHMLKTTAAGQSSACLLPLVHSAGRSRSCQPLGMMPTLASHHCAGLERNQICPAPAALHMQCITAGCRLVEKHHFWLKHHCLHVECVACMQSSQAAGLFGNLWHLGIDWHERSHMRASKCNDGFSVLLRTNAASALWAGLNCQTLSGKCLKSRHHSPQPTCIPL
jgi:hypothetical protein